MKCDNCYKVELTPETRDPDYPLLCVDCGRRFRAVRCETHELLAELGAQDVRKSRSRN